MRNVFFIHGVGSDGTENWFPWLKRRLELLGCNVIVPRFPTPANQTLKNWLAILERYKSHITPDSIFVGHSLGVAFLLNILETTRAKAAFFVAGVSGPLDNEFDDSMKTFSHRKFDWDKIRNNCRRFYIFHSDDDPYIPLPEAEKLAQNLHVDLILVKGAGHINESAGYTKFDLLLENIKKEL